MTWGVCATILAPTPDILRFVAHHLDQGAHRLYIYLDEDTPDAYKALKSHPKVRVQNCDAAHWKRLGGTRPQKHQVRQTANATHAYNRRSEVDWLIHMDVDEFLVTHRPVDDVLSALGPHQSTARVRPMEMLSGSTDAFKAFIPAGRQRRKLVQHIYPTYGAHLTGGFLSHVAGKLFVRTGLTDITVRIHNAFQQGKVLPGAVELSDIDLAHCHAKTWDAWHAAYTYRLEKGSYRAELKPATPPEKGGMTLHELFRSIEAEQGVAGLRTFYDEVVGDSPDLRARLAAQDVLRIAPLDLDGAVARQFPDVAV
ncbi:MAG: glycosyltransferase family 2 protein [Pseudomonadota bacterium]